MTTNKIEQIYRAVEQAAQTQGLDMSDKALINDLLDVLDRCNFDALPEWAQEDLG